MKNRCCSKTISGKVCKKKHLSGKIYCSVHSKTCAICFDEIIEPKKLHCKHSFCEECIYRWINISPNCPCCRSQVCPYIYNEAIEYNIHNGNIIKMYKHYYYMTDQLFLLACEMNIHHQYLSYTEFYYFKERVFEDNDLWDEYLGIDTATQLSYISTDEYNELYSFFQLTNGCLNVHIIT
jgi:hypothetical protein